MMNPEDRRQNGRKKREEKRREEEMNVQHSTLNVE